MFSRKTKISLRGSENKNKCSTGSTARVSTPFRLMKDRGGSTADEARY